MLGSQRGTGDSSLVECWVLKEALVIKTYGMLGSQGGTGDQDLRNIGFSRRHW